MAAGLNLTEALINVWVARLSLAIPPEGEHAFGCAMPAVRRPSPLVISCSGKKPSSNERRHSGAYWSALLVPPTVCFFLSLPARVGTRQGCAYEMSCVASFIHVALGGYCLCKLCSRACAFDLDETGQVSEHRAEQSNTPTGSLYRAQSKPGLFGELSACFVTLWPSANRPRQFGECFVRGAAVS
ncbi:hypothetical protein V8C37DRAFT_367419, partial [Trichoderma ceciliae]